MTIDERLLELLRCPACKGTFADPGEGTTGELVCTACERRYPVRNGVPVLLVDEAVGGPSGNRG
ncbi:Trm112 family protein [Nocardioides caldifontis]|uniref:Trm112 family protein n=1 Tax=Nocardioides caldifontis TaxID=2588938 RepID=UPI0011DF7548|nr:Trm112 family protein [Nocardioides caldifontis]